MLRTDLDLSVLYLRKHILFTGLTEDELAYISQLGKSETLRKKDKLKLNGSSYNRVYLLIKGKLKLSVINNEAALLAREILYPNEVFGNVSLKELSGYEMAQALTSGTMVFYFTVKDFKSLLKKNHQLALNYTESLTKKLDYLKDKHSVWAGKGAQHRLVFFLRKWAEKEGVQSNNSIVLQNHLPLSDIADILSVSRQLMYTILSELEGKQLMFYRKDQIILNKQLIED